MTEFTKEFIAEQKKLLSSYTTEGVFENPNVDYSFELDILQRHYPKALDHIEHLQAETKRLKHYLEEAAHAAACGKNPADYLATEVPTELRDEIERLQQRIVELEQERRWIPVIERLPEDSRIYDVAIAGYEYSWTGTCVFGKWIGESGKAILGVTHWKYRPQPPQEEE